jgi:ABC-type Fe3+ transport system permease subunit
MALPAPFDNRWRAYLPTHDEQGVYRGPLSTFAEYHAVGVGFVVTLISAWLLLPVVYAAVSGKLQRLSGHTRDAAKELGYVALGAALATVVKRA